MVRGIFIKLNFPYAQYPTCICGITADYMYLFPIAWEVVRNLECAGFKVISMTGDKASPNRIFFRMHRLGTTQSGTTQKKKSGTYQSEKEDWYHSEKEV